MDILEMTAPEIYELGLKTLRAQLGPEYTERFLQQCKPSEYDYTAERHKWLANQPDIPAIAKRIQHRKTVQQKEEHLKAERIAAWREGLLELTDIEIYELGLEILAEELHVYGSVGFLQQHFKQLQETPPTDMPQQTVSKAKTHEVPPQQLRGVEPHD